MIFALANNSGRPICFILLFPCFLVSAISSVLFIKPGLFNLWSTDLVYRSWKVFGQLVSSSAKTN